MKYGDGPLHYVVHPLDQIQTRDFSNTGRLDFVSIWYNVPLYYTEPSPVVTLHLNEFAPRDNIETLNSIVPSLWENEGIVYLRNPALYSNKDTLKPGIDADRHVLQPESMKLINVANFEISVEIAPKGYQNIDVAAGEGIKVLYGSLTFNDASGQAQDPTPGKAGAETWRTAADVPVEATFDVSRQGLSLKPLEFVKVEDLSWGQSFKGVDFTNLSGFHFRFLEDKVPIGHIQFWTAGTGVNCGVHNHSHDIFAELHVSLSAGTKTGGMAQLKAEYSELPEEEILKLPDDAFDRLELQPLQEHGGMWERDSYGRPIRRPNKVIAYPWHKWQAGDGPDVDVWMAVELNPNLYPEQ
ncbi:putative pyranosone dehydratase protein [Neofusicoccum parvum UCRNP2]|uniref:Putative pyranosone dehydratase protein n=1 Tax=Botryosphaeria parva (strain UCR-NP2) TaxID=1287680 RepID=R1GLW4_BOTPV|nr:putative pyranosone dehydratase protein [Neofusicoccum parvum UCRNP2]